MQTWNSPEAAERWRMGAARRAQALGAATERMLHAAHLRPGMRVLDLAAGTGESSLLAAQRVGPDGSVLAVDISASMLRLAADSAAERGLANVHTLARDVSQLELTRHSFDAAISRLGLMFVSDLARVLAEVRSALEPGGRFAALVWSVPERNPYMGTPLDVLRVERGEVSESWSIVRAFSLRDPGLLNRLFAEAGWSDVQVEPVPFERRFDSIAEARKLLMSGGLADVLSDFDESERDRLLDLVVARFAPFERPNGTVVVPGELLLVSGTA